MAFARREIATFRRDNLIYGPKDWGRTQKSPDDYPSLGQIGMPVLGALASG